MDKNLLLCKAVCIQTGEEVVGYYQMREDLTLCCASEKNREQMNIIT